ncbi:hypothetical protein [Streptomyces triticiradicis]|uniref:hypothetical protein n=1 Tax=Streptomyces triticiradicis TaxID=2651189 RepID=UPI001788CFC9|nr:hypothetical protein [Streptomyces triticiradicis]
MSKIPAPVPAPIPSACVPPGTPVWSSEEAARWSRVRGAPWARPLWSVPALLIAVVWAIAAAPEPPCTDAVPCGADWPGMVEVGLAAGLLYWFARLPELALVAAPALAAVVAWTELPDAGPNSLAANLCVLAALGFGWAAARERLTARRRQRDLVVGAAVVRHPLPGPVAPLRRGLVLIPAGLVLLAVAAFCVAEGIAGVREDRHHADRAVRTVAKVVGRDDDSLRALTEDGRPLIPGSAYPEDHRVGGTVTVLEDGSWQRLASEPYDAMGPQLGALAAGLPGLSLLVTGLLARRRAAALRRGPVPVLRVLERMDEDGLVQIHAGDDTACRRPVLAAPFAAGAPDGDEREAAADGEGLEELTAAAALPREAVMFGSPHDGGELLLVTTFRGEPAVLRTSGPVRRSRPDGRPVSAPGTGAYAVADTTATPVPETLVTTGRPLSWGPGPLARSFGAALALIMVGGAAFNARALVTDWTDVKAAFFLLCMLTWLGIAAELLNWRVTADRSGLWLSGRWKVRHLPWDDLRSARYTRHGSVEMRVPDGDHWRLSGVGMPKLERRLGLNPSYVRMAEEVTALRDHPELRPTEAAPGRGRGFPLGPVLLVLTVVVAAAWGLH